MKSSWKSSLICQDVNSVIEVFPSGVVQVHWWMFRCANIVLVSKRSFDAAKFTAPSLLPWIFSRTFSFPVVILEIQNSAFTSPDRIFMSSCGTDRIPGQILHGQCCMNHHFYPQLGDKINHFVWGLKVFIFQSTRKLILWKKGAEDNVCTWDAVNEKLWMLFKKGVWKLITSHLVSCCYCSEMKEIEVCWKCSLDGNKRNVYSIFLRNAAGKGYL